MSGYSVAAVTGSEGEKGVAHQVHRGVGKLKVVLSRRGAHGGDDNSSPELLLATGSLSRCRGRGYRARQCKTKGALDA